MQLAEFNLAQLAIALEDPGLLSFLQANEAVNEQMAGAEGFIWRDYYFAALSDPNPFGNDALATITVWDSIESLRAFTYSGAHRDAFASRRDWFRAPDGPSMVLWWVPEAHQPEPDEARSRLAGIRANGPTADGFNFARSFPAP